MRKLLFGTTALVGASMLAAGAAQAAEPIKIVTFGWVNELIGVSNVDEGTAGVDFNSAGVHMDGQINFKGSTTLDNGLEVGVRIELEIPAPASKDEAFVWIKGDFGEMRGGNHNSAGYAMLSGVPGVGAPINSGWISAFIPAITGFQTSFRSVGTSTGIDFTNDDNTIIYFTPRFSGFQLGASFTPNAVKSNQNTGITDTAGVVDKKFALKGGYHNGVAIAATFVESFNGFSVDFGASYARAEEDDLVAAAGGDAIEQVMVSANIGTAGFTIGGQYANQLEGRCFDTACLRTNEGQSYGVGATYATGPWTVGVSFIHTETEDTQAIAGDDELDAVNGGIAYSLGPGIKTDFTVMWADWQDEAGASQDGIAGIIGFYVSF